MKLQLAKYTTIIVAALVLLSSGVSLSAEATDECAVSKLEVTPAAISAHMLRNVAVNGMSDLLSELALHNRVSVVDKPKNASSIKFNEPKQLRLSVPVKKTVVSEVTENVAPNKLSIGKFSASELRFGEVICRGVVSEVPQDLISGENGKSLRLGAQKREASVVNKLDDAVEPSKLLTTKPESGRE